MATKEIGSLKTRLSFEDEGALRSLEAFRRDLKGLRSEMNLVKSKGREYTQSLKGMREQSDILSRRLKVQQERVQELKKRYDDAVKVKGEDAEQTKNLAVQYNNAVAEMNRTEQQLEKLNAEIRRMESPWTKLGDRMTSTGEKMQKFGRAMTDFGKSYTMHVTTPIVAGGTAVFKAAMDYESAFAGVRKTVDATEVEFQKLSDGIRAMAKEMPASATEIAGVAEAAGQLGIKTENILSFTRTMINLGEATNLSAEQAATSLARFANIVGMNQKDFDRLGSSVVALGNNFATTEAEIVEMAMRLAGVGNQVGMTEPQIMALAAALSSVGIEAEAGGSAMSAVLKKMQNAVSEGGKTLKKFAEAAGMSAQEFASAFQKDPVIALDAFIKGLANSSAKGKNLNEILAELGIKGIRESDAILRLAGASDLLSEAVSMSTKAWEENTALTKEAEQRYATTESRLRIMWNRVKDVAISLGGALAPAIMDAIDAAEPLIRKIESGAKAFSEMDKEQQRTILKFIALAAAVGPASVVMGNLTTAIGGVLKVGGSLANMLGKADVKGGTGLLGRIALLGPAAVTPVGLAIAGVTAVGIAISKLTKDSEGLRDVNLEVANSLSEQALSLEESVETFNKLSEKAKISNEELARLNDLNIQISQTSNPAEIEQLQKQYDELAKKSGLSKEELQKLFEVNKKIIQQSPDVETSISKQGNEFVKNTKKVEKYIQSLLDLSRQELADELVIAETKRLEILRENKKIEEDIAKLNQMSNELREKNAVTVEERLKSVNDRIVEIRMEILKAGDDQERINELRKEEEILVAFVNEGLGAGLAEIKKQRDALTDKLAKNDLELQKINALNEQMASIVLKQVGINEEGEKGLAALDKAIEKNTEELLKLEEKRKKTGELTKEEQKRYDELSKTVEERREARDFLAEELGIYRDIDTLVNAKMKKLDKETQKRIESLLTVTDIKIEEGNIVKQLQKKNEELLKERERLEENRKKQGANTKEIDKQIELIDDKIWKNDRVIEQILKELGIWDDVKDSIDLGTKRLESQGIQIQKNNKHTELGIQKERERTKEAGKSVEKKVTAKDHGTVANINKRAAEPKNKTINLKEKGLARLNKLASSPITKKVNLFASWTNLNSVMSSLSRRITSTLKKIAPGFASGTNYAPAGLAILGEEGPELVRYRNQWAIADFGLYNLRGGEQVFTHDQTMRIIRALNRIPGYANGTNMAAETNRIVQQLNSQTNSYELIEILKEQNRILLQILQKDPTIQVESIYEPIKRRFNQEQYSYYKQRRR